MFDVVLLESWIYKSVIKEDGRFYGYQHMQNNLADAIQLIARIMRGSKDHALFVVNDESDARLKFSNVLKAQNPSWNYYEEDYAEVMSKIPERTVQEPTKMRLYKETRRLRDGTKELIYRMKATEEEIKKAPDHIDI